VRDDIEASGYTTILDVGCFDGAFLAALSDEHACFGVEINDEAAARAAERGVTMVGRTMDEVRNYPARFDVITAFDVIEHVLDPKRFVADACKALAGGGAFYVGSGNTDAPSWRFMKNRYWYCANLEHVSFINLRWAQVVADELRVSVAPMLYYSHGPDASNLTRLGQSGKNILARFFPSLFATLRMKGLGEKRVETREQAMYPPHWSAARDHVLLKFTAPA
jgi:SAM-dependent methyltransferase